MRYANEDMSAIRKICTFFQLDKPTSLTEIVSYISTGDETLELLTLQLLHDKIIHNRYFKLNTQSYRYCKRRCSRLLLGTE